MNLSERRAGAYVDSLADVGRRIEVWGPGGESLPFDQGVEQAMRIISVAAQSGRRLFFVGNGGSAAIASHMATDYTKNGGMRAQAFNDASLLTCLGNDLGYPRVFAFPIERFADPGDVVIAISSSGQSDNIVVAADAAAGQGCRVISLSGFTTANRLRAIGDLRFYVPSFEYGQVEILHLVICHCVLDNLMARQGRTAASRE